MTFNQNQSQKVCLKHNTAQLLSVALSRLRIFASVPNTKRKARAQHLEVLPREQCETLGKWAFRREQYPLGMKCLYIPKISTRAFSTQQTCPHNSCKKQETKTQSRNRNLEAVRTFHHAWHLKAEDWMRGRRRREEGKIGRKRSVTPAKIQRTSGRTMCDRGRRWT